MKTYQAAIESIVGLAIAMERSYTDQLEEQIQDQMLSDEDEAQINVSDKQIDEIVDLDQQDNTFTDDVSASPEANQAQNDYQGFKDVEDKLKVIVKIDEIYLLLRYILKYINVSYEKRRMLEEINKYIRNQVPALLDSKNYDQLSKDIDTIHEYLTKLIKDQKADTKQKK